MAHKRCSICTKGPKVCQENILHTITPPPPPAWTIETRQDRAMLSCSLRQILTLPSECRSRNRDSSDQATFSNLLLSNFGTTGVVFCCCSPSASGFDVLCVQMLCGVLHTLVVTSGYLSYCCLSVISNQSTHSPLISDINKAFSTTQLPLTGYFLFFGSFSVNPRDGCAWKSQYQQVLKYSDQLIWHQQPFHV